eukprot:3265264-Lingulodinium_polyedra.AAC.1
MGSDGGALRPQDVVGWLVTDRTQLTVQKKARMSRRLRGPGAERDEPARAYAPNARLYRRRDGGQFQSLKDDGTV